MRSAASGTRAPSADCGPGTAGGARGAGARRLRRRGDSRQRVRIRSERTSPALLTRSARAGGPARSLRTRQQRKTARARRDAAARGEALRSPRGGSGTAGQRSRQWPGWRRPAGGARARMGPEQQGVGGHLRGKAQADRVRGQARAGPPRAGSGRRSKRAQPVPIPATASAGSVTRVAPPDLRSEVRLRLPRGQRQRRRQQRGRAWRARKAGGDECPCVVRHQRLRWVGELASCG